MTYIPSRRLAVLIAITVALGFWLAHPAPLTAVDQEQLRLNQAAPAPRGETTIGQTFVAAHNGFSAVELLAAVYPDTPAGAILTLCLLDEEGHPLAASSFSSAAHNTPLRLSFNPLPHSAGKTYTLRLEGTADNHTTVWAYGLDGYAHGTLLINGAPAPGDLRFSTTYTYLWSDVLADVVTLMGRLARVAIPLWLILFAPGLLMVDWVWRHNDPALTVWARWGMALGFSLSLLPLAWLWITALGLRWSAAGLGIVYALAGFAVVWRAVHPLFNRRDRLGEAAQFHRRPSTHDIAMALILLLGFAARLLAVRGLAFPAWVDSPHHLIIARLLAEAGRVPDSYLPFLPVDRFTYHFGFHALAVTAYWLTPLSLIEVFLLVGQVLNSLAPLVVYTFVAGLTDRPRAGLAAAFFVGLVSLFPSYYVSWGRYTQLTGVLILAPALAAVWRMVRPRLDGRVAPHFEDIVSISMLTGGLLLTHYRVLAFFAVFILAALAGGGREGWKWIGAAIAIGGLLTTPWLLRLGAQAVLPALKTPGGLASPSGYNDFPVDYFRRGLEEGWVAAALLAAGWGLVRLDRGVWVTVGWTVVTFALLNIGPGTWVVNNNAWAITLFIPGALALGWGADRWLSLAEASLQAQVNWFRRAGGGVMLLTAAGLVAYAGLQGLIGQVNVANPTTVLATADDQAALDWVKKNVPDDAVFLINGWKWQADIWAGSDGGTWVWPLTGRRTTLPPADYTFQITWREVVNAFSERAAKIQDARAPETLALLKEAGVTHIFIGAKGGMLRPEMFIDSPNYHLLYTNGAAWVFEVVRIIRAPP